MPHKMKRPTYSSKYFCYFESLKYIFMTNEGKLHENKEA